MGSRVMHMIVSLKVIEKLPSQNKSLFLLGGIAPDAVDNKETSHFYKGSGKDLTRYIDYEAFLTKYHTHPQRDYILGYYTHLVTDDIWLKGFYLPWLKDRLEKDTGMLQQYHGDFDLLNSKLLNYYKIDTDMLRDLRGEIGHLPNLDEVMAQNVHKLMDALESDMCISDEKLNAKLKVFTLQQIIGYIETAVQQSILLLLNRQK